MGFLTLALQCRSNLTLLPSVSPAAQPFLGEASIMEPPPGGTGAMDAAPTGAPPRLGHIKTQEKHLTIIGSLKLCVCERKEPSVTSFSPDSALPSLTLFTTEQADIL